MLHILLMILKIIGIILAIILAMVLLVVAILMFSPFRYRIDAKCDGSLDSLNVAIKFSWLYRLIAGYVTYQEQKTDWQLRIFWKQQNVEDKKEETAAASDEEESYQEEEKSYEAEKVEEPKKLEQPEETEGLKVEERSEDVRSSVSMKSKEPKKAEKRAKKNIFEKIKYTFRKICDKIKLIGEKAEKVQEFIENEIHRKAFLKIKEELFRLLRFLKPKKLIGRVHFGFEEPDLTGKALGWLSIFYPFYADHLILEPDFQEEVLEGELHVEGKVRIAYMAVVCLRIFICKEVRTTFQHIRKLKL